MDRNQQKKLWVPKNGNNISASFKPTHGTLRPPVSKKITKQVWRERNLPATARDTCSYLTGGDAQVNLAAEDIVLDTNRSSFCFVEGDAPTLNIRVLPFRNMVAFLRAHIYKPMPLMLTYSPEPSQQMFEFCKNLQYTFIVHTIKASLCPVLHQFAPTVVRVEKRTWDTAFAPLISMIETAHTPGHVSEIMDTSAVILRNTATDDEMRPVHEENIEGAVQGLETTDQETASYVTVNQEHKDRKKKVPMEIDTTLLRRSTRANKYDGFKAPSMAEGRVQKSKVKPRQVPAAPNQATTTSAAAPTPPPTPIQMLQQIGTIKCGVPAEELTASKLMAELEDAPASST